MPDNDEMKLPSVKTFAQEIEIKTDEEKKEAKRVVSALLAVAYKVLGDAIDSGKLRPLQVIQSFRREIKQLENKALGQENTEIISEHKILDK